MVNSPRNELSGNAISDARNKVVNHSGISTLLLRNVLVKASNAGMIVPACVRVGKKSFMVPRLR